MENFNDTTILLQGGEDEVCCEKPKVEHKKTNKSRRKTQPRQHKEIIHQDESVSLLCSLLYAHTYFLNFGWSKTISMGFNPETFQLNIILNDCFGERRVVLSTFEWGGLFYSLQKVMKLVETSRKELVEVSEGLKTGVNSYSKQRIRITPSFSLLVEQNLKEVVVVFQHNQNGVHSSLSLNYEEWIRLYSNMDFFNSILDQLKQCTIVIVAYFEAYVLRCVEHPTEAAEFFVLSGFSPSDISKFARIYYEISVLCKNNVKKLVELEKRARGIIV